MSRSAFLLAWLFRLKRRRFILGIGAVLSLSAVVILLYVRGRPAELKPEGRDYAVSLKARVHCTGSDCPEVVRVDARSSTGNSSKPPSTGAVSTGSKLLTEHNSSRKLAGAGPSHSLAKHDCDWVNAAGAPPYFLTAVFIVRIYQGDKSEMTTSEIKQWLEYLRYAGVEHVYLYDAWYLPGESQEEALDIFIKEKYLTYVDWHKYNPYIREKTQLPAYQHCIDNYGKESTWQAAIDIDEYPFSPSDTEPGFLYRFVKRFSEQHSEVSEITMKNYLFLGEKGKDELLIERLWRHTHGPSNPLVKPIYKPSAIKKVQIHHNKLRSGRSRESPQIEMRMNHYWGARLQNWGPDTKESLVITEEDRGMEPIVAVFKQCENYVRPYLQ